MLSTEERERSSRFIFDKDREKYIIAHGILRVLLSNYLGKEPCNLELVRDKYQKLFISDNFLKFNISHSQDIVVIAVSKNIDLGIDVEYINRKIGYEDIAAKYFSRYEYKKIMSSEFDEGKQKELFFSYWVSKEAFIKLIGRGLHFPLNKFTVDIENENVDNGCGRGVVGRKINLLALKSSEFQRDAYRLVFLKMPKDYVAVLGVKATKFCMVERKI